ncbi:MAG: hypothetical protein IH984_00750 [Planctomycetes bacterium]|nr:hypothetical protein [Planctomycetota bacterium]
MLWTILFLVVIDVAVGYLFAPPPVGVRPGPLQRRFAEGRSVEGKLDRMVGETDESSAPMATAGWYGSRSDQPTHAEHPDGLLVAVYGMSTSFRMCYALQELEPSLTLRLVGGPNAPLSHSYNGYLKDRNHHEADVVLLGVSAWALAGIESMTQMLIQFDAPALYTYPVYRIVDGKLVATTPLVQSLDELRCAMGDTDLWEAFRLQLAENDAYYDELVFRDSPLDNSTLVRLLRRGWGQRQRRRQLARVHNADGYRSDSNVGPVAREIIRSFAETVRADGRLPIVILFHEKGFDDHLYALLGPTLKEHGIPFLSTHDLAPASDHDSFLPDGHFTAEVDKRIAREVLAVISNAR